MRRCRFAVVVIALGVAALFAVAGPSVARAAGACPTLDVRGARAAGALAKQPGCRFLKNATKTTGFDVWCDGKGSSRGPCVKARPVPQNCGGHY